MAKKKKTDTTPKRPEASGLGMPSTSAPPKKSASGGAAAGSDAAPEKMKAAKPRRPKNPLTDAIEQVKEAISTAVPAAAPMVDTISSAATSAVETLANPASIPDALTRIADNVTSVIEQATDRNEPRSGGLRPARKEPRSGSLRPAREEVKEPVAPAEERNVAPTATPDTFSLLTNDDLHLFNEGTHQQLYNKMGAHPVEISGVRGTYFATWAPNAERVSVIGNFNRWDKDATNLRPREFSGIWEGFVPGVGVGDVYKLHIKARNSRYEVDKADPFGFRHEVPPETASVVATLDYKWNDTEWMKKRGAHNALGAPMSIYEVHLGSWRRVIEEGGRSLTYREIAPLLVQHVKDAGFTHIELMPVMEHPFFGSWGYQVTGYFAPSSRFGSPTDLMYLIDQLHQNDIGVIFDWVPSHFPTDEHGLSYFDGTHLFEHEDPRQGFHPDWKSSIFNFGRNEVRSFLLSSAIYWLDLYHADGLRVDGVASMLYLDYSRKQGEWIPNKFGGRENLEAVGFLRQVNEAAYGFDSSIQTIAEESTAWPMVSRPAYVGGLGFGMKWDMGWMHDTLRYMSQDPIHRRFHHNALTFRMMYAYTENFVLSLSHDEVVHGKGSLIRKMPGDDWRKFANLRLLFGYMYAQPGKKLLFMGAEIAQWREWDHDGSLDWYLLEDPQHQGILNWMRDLNRVYRTTGAFHELDCQPGGFEWIDCNDSENSVVSCLRRGNDEEDVVIGVFNFTPLTRYNYQIGAPAGGFWKEILNSDAPEYGGSAQGNLGGVEAAPISLHGRPWSLSLTLPPLGAVFFRRSDVADPQ
jgi:1,4-alpha-glucan branching enzyme